jgi:hypothetical protein
VAYFKRADEVAEKNPFHSVNSINYKFEGTEITTRLEKEHSTTKGNKGKKKKRDKLRSITFFLASFCTNKRMN